MPSGKQIKAARMLVDWSAEDLAKKIGVSRVTIQNIEHGVNKRPLTETMEKIVDAFKEVGIEFTDGDGVRRRSAEIEKFEGKEGFDRFYEIVYQYLVVSGGDVCICGSSGKVFGKFRSHPELHRKRMAALVESRKDISVRILSEEGDTYMPNVAYAQYRWQKKEYFSPTTFYVFGDNLGIISFAHDPAPLVILIKSAAIADSYRASFNFSWENAKAPVPPKELANE